MYARKVSKLGDIRSETDESKFISEMQCVLYKDIASIVYSYFRSSYTNAKPIYTFNDHLNIYIADDLILTSHEHKLNIYQLINEKVVNLNCIFSFYSAIQIFKHEGSTYIYSQQAMYKLHKEDLSRLELVHNYNFDRTCILIDDVFFSFNDNILLTISIENFIHGKLPEKTEIIDVSDIDVYQYIRSNPDKICRIRDYRVCNNDCKLKCSNETIKEYVFYREGVFYRYFNKHCMLCESIHESYCQKTYKYTEMKCLPSIKYCDKIYVSIPDETGLICLENRWIMAEECCCYQISKNMILTHYFYINKPMTTIYLLK